MLIPQNLLENPAANLQDKVVDASGRMIGKSTGRLYTLYYKRMISMAFVDPEYAEIGRELTVIWGEPGTRQIPIRAKVARYPYLDLTPNAKYNLDSIPRYTA
jgi:glycine cleavage system aminomethyltransferase T